MDINKYFKQGVNQISNMSKDEQIQLLNDAIPKIQALCNLGSMAIKIAIETLNGIICFLKTGVKLHTITNEKIRTLIEVLENVYELSDNDNKELFKALAEFVKQKYRD